MTDDNRAIPVSAADWYASQARIAALEAALCACVDAYVPLCEECCLDEITEARTKARALLARVENL